MNISPLGSRSTILPWLLSVVSAIFWGGIFGTLFMVLVPEVLRIATEILSNIFPNIFAYFSALRELIFGLVIILFLIFEPDGLAARWHTICAYWKLWPFSY